ncbi:hypothetical protein Tco_0162072 [Tanacetum coccineum]
MLNVIRPGKCYVGQEARTKKQAKMNAAKVAYTALIEGNEFVEKTEGCLLNAGGGVLNAAFMLKKRRDVFIFLADMNFVMGVEGTRSIIKIIYVHLLESG